MIIILILSFIGILDTCYLSYVHLLGGESCGLWLGCSHVLSSKYSRILGIPLSSLGLGNYLCIFFLALRARDTRKTDGTTPWLFYLTLTGSLFSGYLFYLQASVIQHWCPFCILSMALMVGIFALNLWLCISNKSHASFFKTPHWNCVPKLIVVLIVPTAAFLGFEHAIKVITTNTILKDSEVVAHLGKREITLGEVNHGIRLGLNQIEWKRFEMKLSWIENELMKMEADRQGVTLNQLKKGNIDDAITISEEEAQKFYQSYQKKVSEKIPFQKVKGKIYTHLKKQKMKSRREIFLTQLKQDYDVSILLPKPLPLGFNENPHHGPEKGPTESSITILFFTDFECPFCAEAYRKIKNLLVRHPQDVRVIFRHFPLKIHKNAHDAAYAAACAHLQGMFWPYADILFKNQGRLTLPDLYDYADQVGLDMETFKQCMELEQGREIVEADIADGLELGINTTPVLFFNGHFIKGFPKPRHLQLMLDQYLPATDMKKPEG